MSMILRAPPAIALSAVAAASCPENRSFIRNLLLCSIIKARDVWPRQLKNKILSKIDYFF
jgi:hypothetical protein